MVENPARCVGQGEDQFRLAAEPGGCIRHQQEKNGYLAFGNPTDQAALLTDRQILSR